MNPVHAPLIHLCKNHFNAILTFNTKSATFSYLKPFSSTSVTCHTHFALLDLIPLSCTPFIYISASCCFFSSLLPLSLFSIHLSSSFLSSVLYFCVILSCLCSCHDAFLVLYFLRSQCNKFQNYIFFTMCSICTKITNYSRLKAQHC